MNRVLLTGRLVRDIELRYTQSGLATASFSLAVDKGLSKEKRQEAEQAGKSTADFPRVLLFGKQAENASRYLSKGSRCLIDGRIQTGSYTDKNGNRVFTTDVVADRVEFLDSHQNAQNAPGTNNYSSESNYTNKTNGFDTGQNMSDFYDDDFEDFIDDGRIPF